MITLIKAFIEPYLYYIKLGLSVLVLAAGLVFVGYFTYLYHTVDVLKEKNQEISTQLVQATGALQAVRDNANKCYESNSENKKTIELLLATRQAALDQLGKLEKSKVDNAKKLNELKIKIDEMAKDKSNDGPVAPVLKETLRALQAGDKK